MSEQLFHVEGMTCAHCVAAVTREVGSVSGVQRVEVDLPTGRLVVGGDADPDAIRAAVVEAGYTLV